VARLWWPVLRIGGFVLTAPIASESSIPPPVKIALSIALAFILAPLAPVPGRPVDFFRRGLLAAVQEIADRRRHRGGRAALVRGAHLRRSDHLDVEGLGFATLIDPQHGGDTPVLGQLFMILGTLAYLAVNGHLVLIGALANSFKSLPSGAPSSTRTCCGRWGCGRADIRNRPAVALPALVALIIVNLALGVVTAPRRSSTFSGSGSPSR